MFLFWRRQGIQQGLYFQHNDYQDYLKISGRIESQYDLQSYIMEEPAEEVKILIHHILNRYKFYRLEIGQYFEILDLLRQPRSEDARMIQQSVFRGVVAFNNINKDRVGVALQNSAFQNISLQMKSLMHKILHQFHFLNCIRAYEMFQERFRQPATLSQNTQQINQVPFDDELEKARLHYMYYGPYSVYHINNLSPQQPINLPFQQNFYPVPTNQAFQTDPFPQRSQVHQDSSFLVKQLRPKVSHQKDLPINRSNEGERTYGTTRGRPPKQKKKMLERLSQRRISEPLRKILQKNHRQIQILQQRDEIFQYCVCRGFLRIREYFCCQRCGKYYHPTCLGRDDVCLGCNMKIHDNFNKVNDTIGMYFLDWWDEFQFQQLFNMKKYEKICKTGRFQIMIACSLPNSRYPVWPDGAVLKINGEPVFQISPLLKAHQVKQRADGVCFITPYIFDQGFNGGNLQKIKIELEAVVRGSEYRDNRRNTFLLGIFLVQKASVQRLVQEILEYNRIMPTVNPVQAGFFIDEYYEIDQLSVSCADPYSKQMIETPVRGQQCRHLGCFDLQTFLVFQQKSQKRSWLCPICKNDARILIVDKYQLTIMEQIRDLSKAPGKIIYFSNGSIDFQDGYDENSEDSSSSHN